MVDKKNLQAEFQKMVDELDANGVTPTGFLAMGCFHPRIHPQVFDQALGVVCPDCDLAEWCWAERHCSEFLWNLACKNDPDAEPCEQNRHEVCAMCDEEAE